MNTRKVMLIMVLSLVLMALAPPRGFPQEAAPGQPPGNPQPEANKTTMTGKIVYLKSFGGYLVITETPHEEYKIINENPKVLGELAKNGKPVTIDGSLPRGAYLLFIDKIDGKHYQGGK